MYQYITAILAAVSGLQEVSGIKSVGRFKALNPCQEQKNTRWVNSLLNGLMLTSGLLLSSLILDSWFGFGFYQGILRIAFIAGVVLLVLGVLGLKYVVLKGRYDSLYREQKALARDKKLLQQRLNDLATHSAIARVAASSKSFSCFMHSITELLHKDEELRELTVFTTRAGIVSPFTYYKNTDKFELCLTFAESKLQGCLGQQGNMLYYNPELFGYTGLTLEYAGGNIIVEGGLLFAGCNVGRLRVVTPDLEQESGSSLQEAEEALVNAALVTVNIGCSGISRALNYSLPVLCEASASTGTLMLRLETADMVVGLLKVEFETKSPGSIYAQKRLLLNASSHIAKALYSHNLYELSVRDGLTGLFNKRYLEKVLADWERDYRLGLGAFAFILVDIDHFKKVNDTWGHRVGDMVLRRVAGIIMASVRDSDIVCRFGGEEIALILKGSDLAGAERFAERIRQKIAGEVFSAGIGDTFVVTASFGVAEMEAGFASVDILVEAADQALYRAKASGRNTVESVQSLEFSEKAS